MGSGRGVRVGAILGVLAVAVPTALRADEGDALPPVADCIRALDGSPDVRRQALWDLWAHGPGAAVAVPAVAREYARSPGLRWDAAFALAATGDAGVAAMAEAWTGADGPGRSVLMRAFAYGAARAAPPESLLREALGSAEDGTVLAALAAARRLAWRAGPLAPAVADIARGSPTRRAAAVEVLGGMGAAGVEAAGALLGDPSAAVRCIGAEVAGGLGPAAAPLVASLAAAAKGRDADLAHAALLALARVGPAAAPAVPVLKGLLTARDLRVRMLATTALAAVGRAAGEAAPPLTVLLRDRDPALRVAAAEALGRVGPGPGSTVAALTRALRDDEALVRVAVAESLGALGPVAGEASTALRLASEKDVDPAVRQAAGQAHVAVNLPAEPVQPAAAAPEPVSPRPAFLRARRTAASREAALRRLGADTPARRTAVDRGIDWLLRHQSPDGRWACSGFEARCKGERCGGAGSMTADAGVTSLALLALLAEGTVPDTSPRGTALRKGLDWLLGCLGPDGSMRRNIGGKGPYYQATATLVLVEGAAVSDDARLRRAAQGAVDVLLRWRTPSMAWRYGVRDGDSDVSVASWAMPALAEAAEAGFDVDPGVAAEVSAYLDRLTDPEFGRIGYTARGNGPARLEDLMDRFPADKSESCTAVGLCARAACGTDLSVNPLALRAQALLLMVLPAWDEAGGLIDVYYWRGGSEVAARAGGSFGRRWTAALHAALIPAQRTGGDAAGSWDPLDPWGGEVGRVYTTAMALLALQAPYRDGPPPSGP